MAHSGDTSSQATAASPIHPRSWIDYKLSFMVSILPLRAWRARLALAG
jgi:hypothetical protein